MKKSPSKTAKKRAAPVEPVPRGLSLLLSLFGVGNEDAAILDAARRHTSDVHEWQRGHVSLKPQAAVDIVYPGLDEPPTDDTIMKAGLMMGAAVAWLVMTDLNGGAR